MVLLCEQLSPVKPSGQRQRYWLGKSIQVPLAAQGLLAHSSISEEKEERKIYISYYIYTIIYIILYDNDDKELNSLTLKN